MSQRVIDPLEIIQIDEQHRKADFIAARIVNVILDLAEQIPSVRQSGQFIMVGQEKLFFLQSASDE